MKALSIKAPWAQFIIYGVPLTESVDLGEGRSTVKYSGKSVLKDIENRDWAIPSWFKLPQRIYVHVGKREDNSLEAIWDLTCRKIGLPMWTVLQMQSPLLGRGVIIGEVDIVDCVTESKSPWFTGKYGFILRNPTAYQKPIPCKGRLGFFDVPEEILEHG